MDENRQEMIAGMTSDFPYCMHVTSLKYTVPWHWHEEVEFDYVTDGRMEVATNSGTYVIEPEEAFFINTNVLSTKKMAEGDEGALEHSFMFDPILLSGFYKSIFEKKYIKPVLKNRNLEIVILKKETDAGRRAMQALKKLSVSGTEEFREFRIRNLLSDLWICLIRTIRESSEEHPPVSSPNQERILGMMNFIRQHYAEKLTLSDIAASAGIGERECLRCFRKSLGKTPFGCIMEYRMNRAREMLSGTSLSITEIALRNGFSNSAYFAKIFRQNCGMTPGEFRKNPEEEV